MIVKNRIAVSAAIVYTFWYLVLYLVAGLLGHGHIGWVLMDYPASMLAIGLGAGVGAMATLGLTALKMQSAEAAVSKGGAWHGANVTLGDLPDVAAEPAANAEAATPYLTALHARKWWGVVAQGFPAHAAALDALMRIMAREPRLPASRVPGGHGDRTLIEHSLGVADMLLRDARHWCYAGQRDKRGRIQVPLEGTAEHKFGKADFGLLALAGFAHDIGKLACYHPSGPRVAPYRTLPVTEALPNHDTEGAALLRRVPEIMALPYRDRRDLLTAVGYYHHAGSLPLHGPLDDRTRSLTELLIVSDARTGSQEAGTQVGALGAAGQTPPKPAPAAATPPAAGVPPQAPVTPVDPAAASAQATVIQTGDEVAAMMRALASPSAIGSKVANRMERVGYRCGDKLLIVDAMLRKQVSALHGASDALVDSTYEITGNATEFTARLLTQLAEQNLILRTYKDLIFVPQKSLFTVQVKGNKHLERPIEAVFVMPLAAVPSLAHAPDEGEFEILRPFWGEQVGRKIRPTNDPAVPASGPEPASLDADKPPAQITVEPPDAVTPSPAAAPDLLGRVGCILHETFASLKCKDIAGQRYLLVPHGSKAGGMLDEALKTLAPEYAAMVLDAGERGRAVPVSDAA